jgi:hypothetical protein
MVAKVITKLQLTPKSREPIGVAESVAPVKPGEHKQWKQTRRLSTLWGPASAGEAMLWVSAAVLLMVMCVPGAFRLDKVRVPQFRKAGDAPSLTLKAAPTPAPAPTATNTVSTLATAHTTSTMPLEPGNAVIHPVSARASASVMDWATPVHEPSLVDRTIPKPSVGVHPTAPVREPLPAYGSIHKSSAAAQDVVTPPQASAAAQSPSKVSDVNAATSKQSQTRAGQSGSPAVQVRPALTGNTPVAAQAGATMNVRPALPESYR